MSTVRSSCFLLPTQHKFRHWLILRWSHRVHHSLARGTKEDHPSCLPNRIALRGYTETMACNVASKVIEQAVAYQPDILLVDIRWDSSPSGEPQNLQGDDILREIKNRKLFPKAFVIALTQELNTADKAAFNGKWEGFHIILKSASPDSLIADLQKLGAL